MTRPTAASLAAYQLAGFSDDRRLLATPESQRAFATELAGEFHIAATEYKNSD